MLLLREGTRSPVRASEVVVVVVVAGLLLFVVVVWWWWWWLVRLVVVGVKVIYFFEPVRPLQVSRRGGRTQLQPAIYE